MDDLYSKMGDELRALFKILFNTKKAHAVRQQMDKILSTAHQIGDPVKKEAQQLKDDIDRFLEHPKNPKLLALMKVHALRLEQETREI